MGIKLTVSGKEPISIGGFERRSGTFGYSPYIDSDTGTWIEYDAITGWHDTGIKAQGEDGKPGQPGKDGAVKFEDLTPEQREMLRGEPGRDGPPGRDGQPGKDGHPGSDANVTATNIENALGFKPVSEKTATDIKEDLSQLKNTTETPVAAGKVWTATDNGAGWVDPQGGGGDEKWELINVARFTEEAIELVFDKDKDGNPFALKKFRMLGTRIMPEAGSHNAGGFRITDGTSKPNYNNGLALMFMWQGAGNRAGSVIHFNFVCENVLYGIADFPLWVSSLSQSGNETSVNGTINAVSAGNVCTSYIARNNTFATFEETLPSQPKLAKAICLSTYGGTNLYGVGSVVYLYGVRGKENE